MLLNFCVESPVTCHWCSFHVASMDGLMPKPKISRCIFRDGDGEKQIYILAKAICNFPVFFGSGLTVSWGSRAFDLDPAPNLHIFCRHIIAQPLQTGGKLAVYDIEDLVKEGHETQILALKRCQFNLCFFFLPHVFHTNWTCSEHLVTIWFCLYMPCLCYIFLVCHREAVMLRLALLICAVISLYTSTIGSWPFPCWPPPSGHARTTLPWISLERVQQLSDLWFGVAWCWCVVAGWQHKQ